MTTIGAAVAVTGGIALILLGRGIERTLRTMSEDERAGTQFSPPQALGLRIMGWIGIAIGLAGLLGALG